MLQFLPKPLIRLAKSCPFPLYVVGGSVRDFLMGNLAPRPDWDISAPFDEGEFSALAEQNGFCVKSVFGATGTVKLADEEGYAYEFTRFRSDEYVRGTHAPAKVYFTDDIAVDARRRDFCANAVYYEIKTGTLVDPLGGIKDIEKKILRTVAPASKVFGEDGLRLLRLARIAAQTGFSPDKECLAGAKRNAALILEIVPERIYAELELLLRADQKSGDDWAPYRGLTILRETGVLNKIMPELAAGEGLFQRADFHRYDVLEHSFRAVRYAPPSIRWAALLHDAGKPYCMARDGNFYAHPEEGERIAREILTRLKAPKELTRETAALVAEHMRDFNLAMRPTKVRGELVRCYSYLDDLFALKQADFSACMDDLSPAPTVLKWKEILEEMRTEGAPLRLADLKMNGNDLLALGFEPKRVGHVLNTLFTECVQNGALNNRERLVKRAEKILNN